MRSFLLIISIVIFTTLPLSAGGKHPEKYYQVEWCKKAGGIVEYTLEDRTRIDCLTEEYAIEFDFARKWAEAIGQSLYYAIKTNRKPAIVLIIGGSDGRYLDRLKTVTDKTNITVWTIEETE